MQIIKDCVSENAFKMTADWKDIFTFHLGKTEEFMCCQLLITQRYIYLGFHSPSSTNIELLVEILREESGYKFFVYLYIYMYF